MRPAGRGGRPTWSYNSWMKGRKERLSTKSEYYLAWGLKNTIRPQYFADTPSGCTERRYYVISVDSDQLTLLQQSQKTSSGSYYGEPIDTVIGKYIISNTETNHSCASP